MNSDPSSPRSSSPQPAPKQVAPPAVELARVVSQATDTTQPTDRPTPPLPEATQETPGQAGFSQPDALPLDKCLPVDEYVPADLQETAEGAWVYLPADEAARYRSLQHPWGTGPLRPEELPADKYLAHAALSRAADRPADSSAGHSKLGKWSPNDRKPRDRRIVLPVVLFLLTCFTTFAAGALGWYPAIISFEPEFWQLLAAHWQRGLIFMVAVLGMLMAHEMGHFVMTLRHRIPASLPYFIPVPILMIGTMGAVIGMNGAKADRKQLFDIGIAGPIAGLVVAVPLLIYGILIAEVDPRPMYGQPLLVVYLVEFLRPDITDPAQIALNPYYMAGWVGMLITGLNMLPIGQLDGGHVSHAVLGRNSVWLARGLILCAIGLVIWKEYYTWTTMLVLIIFIGVDHPPTANDHIPLGRFRIALGLASFAIPILCFVPHPFIGL